MKIAIDCRYLGKSGIGRYLSGILENLDFDADQYFLIGSKESLDKLQYNFTPIYCDLSPFSLKGLLHFPTKQINGCDAFFSPNFIVPFGIKAKIYTTIHDVIFLDYKDSNNGKVDYLIKKYFLKRALKKSKKVFTVSEFSKKRIKHHFSKIDTDVVITGNALTNALKSYSITEDKIPNSLVYVGNLKKHKGLHLLKEALELLNKQESKYQLTIVGTKDNFRTSDDCADLLERQDVKFTGYLDELDLIKVISSASFLVQPSFYEGFGMPPLEAMYFGTKPIVSDIEVFREVYNDFEDVVFFETGNAKALASAIENSDTRVITTKDDINSKFNYNNFAQAILRVIRDAE
ncbi:MAG: glycosyltransferase family 4 protein [Clostridiales bacterium]|nr:glycosyltransferase family 4 protein [Clostridiales bacterium]